MDTPVTRVYCTVLYSNIVVVVVVRQESKQPSLPSFLPSFLSLDGIGDGRNGCVTIKIKMKRIKKMKQQQQKCTHTHKPTITHSFIH